MDLSTHYNAVDERERLVFRLLLVNKWFLIPSSVAYVMLLTISPFQREIYNLLLPTVLYTSVSLIIIIMLWFAYRRIADTKAEDPASNVPFILNGFSFLTDVVYLFYLMFEPAAGNLLWVLFLLPMALILLAPNPATVKQWSIDIPVACVVALFLALVFLLFFHEETLISHYYLPADLMLCLSAMFFMWISIRIVRLWVDQMSHQLNRYEEITTLWSTMIQQFPVDCFLVNERGELVTASDSARDLLGLPNNGQTQWPEETQSIRNALMLRFHHDDGEVKLNETITVPDDDFAVKIYPAFFTYQNVRYCIAIAQEEHSEIPQQSRIMRSDRLTIAGQIAAGLAHEIGNPLGVIQSCVAYVSQKLGPDDPNQEELELVLRESKRCQNLIERLLSLASPKRDTPGIHDLRTLLEQSYALVKYQAGDRLIDLNLPKDPVTIYANEGQISAVFVNLFLNALQSMEGAEDEARLRISMRIRGDEAIVDITDEGMGIAKDELDKIFDPFFTKKAQGTGLGLSIVHQIISSMDGHIDVASKLGSGTTFTVYLKLYTQQDN